MEREVGQTVALRVPYSDSLVSTRAIYDANHIFHAILSSYSHKYIHFETEEKKEYIRRLRSNFPEMFSKDQWLDGPNSKPTFHKYLQIVLDALYQYTFQSNSEESKLPYSILTEKVDENKDLYKFILQRIDRELLLPTGIIWNSTCGRDGECGSSDIYFQAVEFVHAIRVYFKSTYGKQLNESDEIRFRSVLNKLNDLFTLVTRVAIDEGYSEFKTNLGDSSQWLDAIQHVDALSELFNLNIYFIDGTTNLPLVGEYVNNYTNEKCVIIYINRSEDKSKIYYDIVGVLDGEKIRRTFIHDEILIRKIHAYAHNPSIAIQKYPEFTN